MQRVISYAEERVRNSKNVAKNNTRFFGNSTVVDCTGTIVGWNDTIVGGTGDE